jgi:hypothetical protein
LLGVCFIALLLFLVDFLVGFGRARYAQSAESVAQLEREKRYAQAMSSVHAQFPEDPEVAALYAEALMNLRPWALWDRRDTQHIVPADDNTLEIVRVLEVCPIRPLAAWFLFFYFFVSPPVHWSPSIFFSR